jgi:anti-sigma B factor antagonist
MCIGVLSISGDEMNYTEDVQGDIVVVKVLHTEATLRYALDFRNYLLSLIASGKSKIVVDLTSTTFMDSTFLGAMVYTLKKSVAAGGGLRIIRNKIDSPVWTMFEITNMIKVFKIYEEPQAAVASF